MIQLGTIRENRVDVIRRLAIKGFKETGLVDTILELDEERRATQARLDTLLAEGNKISREIGQLYSSGAREEADKKKALVSGLKEEGRTLEENLKSITTRLHETLVRLPNLPSPDVPEGNGPEDNVKVREGGSKPELGDKALPHWELGQNLDILDFEVGVKITGAGFPVFKGKGARLVRGLISFFLDQADKAGYLEVIPPLMVNEDTAFGTGQLPDKEGQMYYMPEDKFYLIPTAEVPVTNIYRDTIIPWEKLPVKLTAYTPCFRREAGSYGKDVRGLNRVHQFDKVEIVQIVHPAESYQLLDEMVSHVEGLVKMLELPYRILKLCGKDMGFSSALTYDFEVYAAAQKRWLEVSSVSNFETFQSNRMQLRYRDKVTGKPVLAHTLNGSALALPRIIAAIMENNQKDGEIILPAVLKGYTGFDRIGFDKKVKIVIL